MNQLKLIFDIQQKSVQNKHKHHLQIKQYTSQSNMLPAQSLQRTFLSIVQSLPLRSKQIGIQSISYEMMNQIEGKTCLNTFYKIKNQEHNRNLQEKVIKTLKELSINQPRFRNDINKLILQLKDFWMKQSDERKEQISEFNTFAQQCRNNNGVSTLIEQKNFAKNTKTSKISNHSQEITKRIQKTKCVKHAASMILFPRKRLDHFLKAMDAAKCNKETDYSYVLQMSKSRIRSRCQENQNNSKKLRKNEAFIFYRPKKHRYND